MPNWIFQWEHMKLFTKINLPKWLLLSICGHWLEESRLITDKHSLVLHIQVDGWFQWPFLLEFTGNNWFKWSEPIDS